MAFLERIAVNAIKLSTTTFAFIRNRHVHATCLANCYNRRLTSQQKMSQIFPTGLALGCVSCGIDGRNQSLKTSQNPITVNSCRRLSVPVCSVFGAVQCRQFKTHVLQAERVKWSTKEVYSNPLSALEPLLAVPLFDENEQVFKPNVEEVRGAQDLFQPEQGKYIQPLKGVVHFDDLPVQRLPEVAFVGASNVGKSSLIKAIFFDPPDVKISVSKKPGHTKVVKMYRLKKNFCLVDMPGYGENMPPYYVESVEEYILKRQQLVRTFLLIDGTLGLTDEDRIGIEMMEEFGKPYALVLTKIDLATHHIILKNLFELKKERSSWMLGALPQPFLISSKTGVGVAFLRAFVAYITGNLKVDSL